MLVVNALGKCHPDCPWCAKEFFKWMKSRMTQMNRVVPGMVESFSQAASTSVKVPKE